MKRLCVHRAPIGISLQDAGRRGYLRYGVSAAGPMDWARHAMANHMLGKHPAETAIEVGPAGIGLTLDSGELQVSFAGPGFTLFCEGTVFTGPGRFVLKAGQPLEVIPRAGAMWGYLGIQGEFNITPVLGSQAEHRVGGLYARRLSAGCELPVRENSPMLPSLQHYMDPYILYQRQEIAILPSSQFDDFSPRMKARLVNKMTSIAPRFDRMAYQLQGLCIRCDKGHDILSDGVTMGAIQVPGDGHPFILMADHQPTGGYPKIACVSRADLPRIAQMSPGQLFTMCWTTPEQALVRWTTIRRQLGSLKALQGY